MAGAMEWAPSMGILFVCGSPGVLWCRLLSESSQLARLLLGERAAEALLEFGCGGIVGILTQDEVQLVEGLSQRLHQAGRGVVGWGKVRDGGRSVGLAGQDFAVRLRAQGVLR